MDAVLTPIEARIIGCLIEKEMTTPEYYPLTLKALTSACNQKSCRSPVMSIGEKGVLCTIDELRSKHWVTQVTITGSRVPRYKHNLQNHYKDLDAPLIALLAVLMLRGAQTSGELRTRTTRMHQFDSLSELETALHALRQVEGGPLVQDVPAASGKREARHAHLLCGEEHLPVETEPADSEPLRIEMKDDQEHITELEERIASLESDVASLKEMFLAFKQELE